MKKLIIAIGLSFAAITLPGLATAQAATTQTSKMTQCNADAKAKGLKGEERKKFMKECLSAKVAEPAKPAAAEKKAMPATHEGKKLTAQQEKMVTCNADAKTKGLKGEARKKFMKECLSNKK